MLSLAELAKAIDNTKAMHTNLTKFGQPIGQFIQRLAPKLNPLLDRPTPTTVVKVSSSATHAKNIEYRMSRQQELIAIYQSLLHHWGGEKNDDSDTLSLNKETGSITQGDSKKSSKRLRLGGCIFTIEY